MTDSGAAISPPCLLTEAHDTKLFACGEATLDDWLRKRAWQNMQLAASRTYVVCPEGSQQIIAYYALSMGQILAQEVTGPMRRNMPRAIPAIILGRFSIDRNWQGRGLGTAMLNDAVARSLRASDEIATRLIIMHALSPIAEAFYLHHGFTRLPVATPTLALDLVKFEKTTSLQEHQPKPVQ